MMLQLGTQIGPYEITAVLGAGGMGEVYRARDPRLGRDVAIKVLPTAFSTDADRLHRFEREARAAAALNHPNLLAVYDIGTHSDAPFIVSELLEGETLRQRLNDGPVAVRKAIDLALQIASGLAAAHDKGIVHRDLKPENVFITRDGRVKILDFGLAKLTERQLTPGIGTATAVATSSSPTEAGVVLGTVGYMAPEQVRGLAVDHRADLFAFGAILFELLTGARAFRRDTPVDTCHAILHDEPPELRGPSGPVASTVGVIVRRCLEKRPEARFQSASDLAFALETLAPDYRAFAGELAPSPRGRSLTPAWAAAGIVCVSASSVLGLWAFWPGAAAPLPAQVRVSIALGSSAPLANSMGAGVILSPDGESLAFVGGSGGRRQLYVRRLSELQATQLSGTDDAHNPFFSPDGQWIGFFAENRLKKVAVAGGTVVTLSNATFNRGGTWSDDGTIVFSPEGRSLFRISPAGGTSSPLASLAPGEVTQRWPEALPGGRAVLFTSSAEGNSYANANLVAQLLPNGPRRVIIERGSYGRYSASGHLLFVRDGRLFAAPFDVARLEVTGAAVPTLEDVRSNPVTGSAQFSISSNDRLVYLPGEGFGLPMHWIDRNGASAVLRATPASWSNPRFSPDGSRLALEIQDPPRRIVWVYELARDTLTRVTANDVRARKPVWTPDGQRLAFGSIRGGTPTPNLYWQSADGIGEAQRLTESEHPQLPSSWHPSGRFLAFEEHNSSADSNVMILPMEGDNASGWKAGKPRPFSATPFDEREPMFSPDGRWIAFSSNELGPPEIFVQQWPGPGSKWQVSTGGGLYPTWSRTRSELIYSTPAQQIMVASYDVEGDTFRPGKPRSWSEKLGRYSPRGTERPFDLHPDGERLAIEPEARSVLDANQAAVTQVTLIFNLFRPPQPSAR